MSDMKDILKCLSELTDIAYDADYDTLNADIESVVNRYTKSGVITFSNNDPEFSSWEITFNGGLSIASYEDEGGNMIWIID